jgi:hypothetical protein
MGDYIFYKLMTGLMLIVTLLAVLGYSYEIEKLNSKTEVQQYVNVLEEENQC